MSDPRAAEPRALVLVRNTCTHDARVLRVARTLDRLGYETLVLAVVSSFEQSRTDTVQGVRIVRLAPKSLIGRLRRVLGIRGPAVGRAPAPTTGAPAAHGPPGGAAPRPRWPLSVALRVNRLLTTIDYYRRGIAFVRATKPALVHCNDYNTMWIGVTARALVGSAVVYDAHELWPDRNLRPEPRAWLLACETLFVRLAHRTITTSPGHAEVMARRYRIRAPITVRNISDRSPVADARDGQLPERIAVYVGGLTRNRGLEEATAALVHTPSMRLRLVGPGSAAYRAELVDLARQLGVAERVEFVGAVPPERVVDEIKAADAGLALIQPTCLSYRLSLPNKLFEYVAAGLPILGSDLPTIAGFIRTHGVGVVVPPRDIEAIARGLEQVAEPAANAAFRSAVRDVAAQLSWDHEAEVLSRAYAEAVMRASRSDSTAVPPATVSVHDFDPVAESLREGVDSFFRKQGKPLEGASGAKTLETNSGFVKRRGDALLEILYRRSGHSSIAGLDVLDVGCGLGALSLLFASYGATVIGVDPKGERFMVGRRVARRHDLGAQFVRGRAQRLRFPDASFDVAILNNSFCYIISGEERAQALTEVRRVLRPGGWLIMRNPNRLNPIDQFTRLPLLPYLPPHHAARAARALGRKRSLVRLKTPGGAKRELRRGGFADVAYVGRTRAALPAPVDRFARYQHLIARRPEDA